jgi:catechol 2,3-dioxygenase-like lactoylglutathione lyase family enzyme
VRLWPGVCRAASSPGSAPFPAAAFWADTLGFLEVDKGDDFAVFSAGGPCCLARLPRTHRRRVQCSGVAAWVLLPRAHCPCTAFDTGAGQATLRFKRLPPGVDIDHGTGYGRVAFSCPAAELQALQVGRRCRRPLTPPPSQPRCRLACTHALVVRR